MYRITFKRTVGIKQIPKHNEPTAVTVSRHHDKE